MPSRASVKSLSDSFDLRNVELIGKRTGWLDTVQKGKRPVGASSQSPHTAGGMRSDSGSPSGYTPATSRYGGELTAMGSPIPVEMTDASSPPSVSSPSQLRELRLRSASPPECMPPPPLPTAHQHYIAPTDKSSALPVGHNTVNPYNMEHEHHSDAQPMALDSYLRSPLERQRPQAVSASPYPCSTVYSSALMQALSMTEGAATMSANTTVHISTPMNHQYRRHGEGEAREDDSYTDAEKRDAPGTAMYEDGMRAKLAKQQWVSLEKARQGLLMEAKASRECSFRPTVSPYAAKIKRPAALRPDRRVQAELLRRKQWLTLKRQERIEKELEPCTFRPLTLRTVKLLSSPPREEDAKSEADVFEELYKDAEDRKYFEDVVRPTVMERVNRLTRVGGAAEPLREDQLNCIVNRLFSKAAVMAETKAAKASEQVQEYKPQLAAATQRIIAAKVESGERPSDVVEVLYNARDDRAMEAALNERVAEAKERVAAAERRVEAERMRTVLEEERIRSFLSAKFSALATHARTQVMQQQKQQLLAANGHDFHSTDPALVMVMPTSTNSPFSMPGRMRHGAAVPVVGLARATLDIFSTEESDELLRILSDCGAEELTESQFIALVRQHVSVTGSSLLLTAPPPAPASKRSGSGSGGGHYHHQAHHYGDPQCLCGDLGGDGHGAIEDSPPPLPRVKREKPDPAALERAREKREARTAQYIAEAVLRSATGAAHTDALQDAHCTFHPAPRRLIPYECRPDVHVEVKGTRAEQLRRAHNLARRQNFQQQQASREHEEKDEEERAGETINQRAEAASKQRKSVTPAAGRRTSAVYIKPETPRQADLLLPAASTSPAARPLLGTSSVSRKPSNSLRRATPRFTGSYASALTSSSPNDGEGEEEEARGAAHTDRGARGSAGGGALDRPLLPKGRTGEKNECEEAETEEHKEDRADEAHGHRVASSASRPSTREELDAEQQEVLLAVATASNKRRSEQLRSTEALVERAMHADSQTVKELGREMLLKQLRDYRRKRR